MVWLVVGIALALPAGLWLVQVNMEEMTAEWQGRPGLSVYFELGASEGQLDEVERYLVQAPSVDKVTMTSAADALAEFKDYSGLGDALELLNENPLPASLQAQFAEGISGGVVDALTDRLAKQDGVSEVVVEKTWLERLNDISSVVSRLSVVLAILFGVGAVLVTASSVRLAIEARLDELRVLKLVGATAGQIRRPFLYFGAIYGFGGGVIAAMLIAITVVVIEPPLQSLLGSYDQALNMVGFDPNFLVLLLVVGGSLGVVGALLAVRQRLVGLEIF
ncbi:MAG: FtsX-like permease family protein [Pseudomonadales bacterium]|nr:FtsX-like permease family protein [Pseudomonadales bacterium]